MLSRPPHVIEGSYTASERPVKREPIILWRNAWPLALLLFIRLLFVLASGHG